MGHTSFGQSNINLYNNYASASYNTYTTPQFTTANPNRCPANANIAPTSSTAATNVEHCEYETTVKTTNKKSSTYKYGHHLSRKSKFDNGNGSGSSDITVVANNTSYTTTKHERLSNESVIEEGHNNNFVSRNIHLSFMCIFQFQYKLANESVCLALNGV